MYTNVTILITIVIKIDLTFASVLIYNSWIRSRGMKG
jgi:hypothetical protein